MSTAEGAATAIGTMVIEWEAAQDYDASDTGDRGLATPRDGIGGIYFSATEGILKAFDGTNSETLTVDWSRADDLISVLRWSSTASEQHLTNSKNGTWDLNVGNENTFDGTYGLGSDFHVAYDNELPIHIKRIIFYDEYLTDSQLQSGIWKPQASFGMGFGGIWL
jgi:hypothetical protein